MLIFWSVSLALERWGRKSERWLCLNRLVELRIEVKSYRRLSHILIWLMIRVRAKILLLSWHSLIYWLLIRSCRLLVFEFSSLLTYIIRSDAFEIFNRLIYLASDIKVSFLVIFLINVWYIKIFLSAPIIWVLTLHLSTSPNLFSDCFYDHILISLYLIYWLLRSRWRLWDCVGWHRNSIWAMSSMSLTWTFSNFLILFRRELDQMEGREFKESVSLINSFYSFRFQ